jgi:hypothetical protein
MTSIEWLIKELEEQKLIKLDKLSTILFNKNFATTFELLFEQAKKMHKQEIIDAVGVGSQFDRDYLYGYHDKAEQYYQETFKKD